MAVKVTTPGRVTARSDDGREYGKPGPWLDLIHKVNGYGPREGRLFGAPEFTGIRPGADHYVEEYADADVQIRGSDDNHMENQVVTIVSKTNRGEYLIRLAALDMDLAVDEVSRRDEYGVEVTRNGYGIHVGTWEQGALRDLTVEQARMLVRKVTAFLDTEEE